MTEYLNYGALGVLGFIGFITIMVSYNSKENIAGLYILLLIVLGLIFSDAYNEHSNAIQNIYDFKNKNAVLKCFSGGGLHASANTYRVSLDDGWELDKGYFIKDSFMVRVNKCERW